MTPAVCDLPLSRFTTLTKTRSFGTGLVYSCMDWSDDGMHIYFGLLSSTTSTIRNRKSTTTAWDLDALSFVGRFGTGFDNAQGIKVKPDGTEVWVNVSTGLANGFTRSYSLNTPYEWVDSGIDAPVLIDSFNNARTEFDHLEDLNINPEGTKIISPGNNSGSDPYQLDMTAWDGSTLAYGPDNEIADCENAFIPKSGLCMYRANTSTIITKYAFGDAWDLTTLSGTVVDTLDLTSDLTGNIEGIFITDHRLFVLDGTDKVYQYNA